jgi:uncharacterized protein YbjT (DUF2867 family)
MKTVLKILGGLLATVVLLIVSLVIFVLVTLKPNIPDAEFILNPPQQVGGMNVLIFGATGKLGYEVVERLVLRGDKVTAFVRPTSDRSRLEPLGVEFAVGDVMEPATIAGAFDSSEFDAAVVALAGRGVANLDSQGNANVADSAKAAGVERLVMISSVGAGDSYEAAPLISRLALSKILPQKTSAEEHIRASGLAYTILRPGGLPPGIVPTGRGMLSEDPATMGFIKRPDLARLILGVLDDDRAIGKTLAVIDPELVRPWSGADPE